MKIKIGKSNKKKFKADLSFDVSTTTTFGHCQPLMCKEMVPNSEYNVEVDSFVRLAPMVSPTFGRLKYKVWHSFVPLADIYRPFENLLAGREYGLPEDSYVPQEVPQIRLNELSKIVYTLDFFGTSYSTELPINTNTVTGLTTNGVINLSTVKLDTSAQTYFNGAFVSHTHRPWYVNGSPKIWTGGTTTTASTISATYSWGNFGAQPRGNVATWEALQVPVESADMLWFDQYSGDTGINRFNLFAQRLSDRQKRLRKVLLGLGYQLDVNNSEFVSILPLVAYYKAWFTTLFPQRYKTWTDTTVYKLIHALEDAGSYNIIGSSYEQVFADFLRELADTYYYDDSDYVTSQLLDPNQSPASIAVSYVDATGEAANQPSIDATDKSNASIQNTNGSYFDDTAIRLLRVLTKFVNKNNVIGGKISEYLRAHYDADIVNNLLQNYFIGGDSTDIVVSDVMSNAATEGSVVGDYAGYGVGYKDGTNFHFKADTFGYWITFSALVPKAHFFQGIDPSLKHTNRFGFYAPEFDALGYTMTPKSCVYSREGIGATALALNSTSLNAQFGLIPRYSEYKICSKNVVNGDISLPSTRDTLSQYTVDKMLTPSTFYASNYVASSHTYNGASIFAYPTENLFAGIEMREIGKDGTLGNFDRVFYNSESAIAKLGADPYDAVMNLTPIIALFSMPNDNFIVHHIVNVNAKLPMIPLSESWYTDGEDDNSISVDQV